MGRLDRSFRRLADAYCVSYVVVKDRRLPFQPIFPNTADLRTSIDTIQCACGRDAHSHRGSEWTREADCDEDEGAGRTEAIGRMAREELEAGLGRGRYAVGAEWDEGSMVHAMRRFGGRTIGWRFGDG